MCAVVCCCEDSCGNWVCDVCAAEVPAPGLEAEEDPGYQEEVDKVPGDAKPLLSVLTSLTYLAGGADVGRKGLSVIFRTFAISCPGLGVEAVIPVLLCSLEPRCPLDGIPSQSMHSRDVSKLQSECGRVAGTCALSLLLWCCCRHL